MRGAKSLDRSGCMAQGPASHVIAYLLDSASTTPGFLGPTSPQGMGVVPRSFPGRVISAHARGMAHIPPIITGTLSPSALDLHSGGGPHPNLTPSPLSCHCFTGRFRASSLRRLRSRRFGSSLNHGTTLGHCEMLPSQTTLRPSGYYQWHCTRGMRWFLYGDAGTGSRGGRLES